MPAIYFLLTKIYELLNGNKYSNIFLKRFVCIHYIYNSSSRTEKLTFNVISNLIKNCHN